MDKEVANDTLRIAMFKKYMEISTDGVLGLDKNGYIVEINKTYCDFLGTDRDKTLGKHVTEIIPTTKMMNVIQNKLTEIDALHRFGDEHIGVVTSRAAVINHGEAIGGIAQIRFVDRTSELASRLQKLQAEVQSYKNKLLNSGKDGFTFDTIIGENPRMKELKRTSMKVAKHDFAVLLLGETGTGKEVFAHAIHNASPRASRPFIQVNCAAIPTELLESELFGYEDGAFSGAKKGGKPGKIELADKGTLFLDEIADMPLNMQAKLLRVLQDSKVDRLGSVKPRRVDIRVIAATNKDLVKKIEEKTFRDDLFYRLNVIRLELPPLRERTEDVPALAAFYLAQLNLQYETQKCFSHAAENALKHYSWPGNVRELRNVVARSFILADGNFIDEYNLPPELFVRGKLVCSIRYSSMNLNRLMAEFEREILVQTLKTHDGNCIRAAQALGIHRGTLYKKMKKIG